jgi:hypothetical protein
MGSLRSIRSEAAREHRQKYRAVREKVLSLLGEWYEDLVLRLLEQGPCAKQKLLDIDILSARFGEGTTVMESILEHLLDQHEHLGAEFSNDELENLVQDCLTKYFDQQYKEHLLEDLMQFWGVSFNGDLCALEEK